ncbi:YitT family protein [Vaginisenegalia massiliensis]|uniref:YitT family protein n=1 Tax=Vaginisenegalia massiliensis TaxID=2058294 RepID=UPI000F53590F|nr:YitT family protein [Vaginisenegalia massiliensis]
MFNKFLSDHAWANYLLQGIVVIIAAFTFAVSLNLFFIPGDIYSAGVSGMAQLLAYFTKQTGLRHLLSTGNLYFLLNLPLIVLSYFKLGRHFTIMTLVVVTVSSLATHLIPIQVVSPNPIMNAIAGGVISGFGVGLTIKFGMSTGGTDIISLVVSKATGINVGFLSFLINLFVIAGAGILFGWEYALYTIVAMYVASRMIDVIHTNEQRLTCFIVTNKEAQLVDMIHQRLIRGITILDGVGAYSREKRHVLMVVVNRYELYDLQLAVSEVDPNAFVNIIQSSKVSGHFLTKEQQRLAREQQQTIML